MTKIYTLAITSVHPGDVLLDADSGQLIDILEVTDHILCRDRSDYKNTLILSRAEVLSRFRWVRNSPVLLSCYLRPGVNW